jgi:hypothetical protein
VQTTTDDRVSSTGYLLGLQPIAHPGLRCAADASSMPPRRDSESQWLLLLRRHWGVETTHQILDVALEEDDHPWIEQNPRGMLVVAILRRISYRSFRYSATSRSAPTCGEPCPGRICSGPSRSPCSPRRKSSSPVYAFVPQCLPLERNRSHPRADAQNLLLIPAPHSRALLALSAPADGRRSLPPGPKIRPDVSERTLYGRGALLANKTNDHGWGFLTHLDLGRG